MAMRSGKYAFLALLLGSLIVFFGGTGALQAQDAGKLGREQIEALVAPIALYPDALLAQILMASSYPLEVVKAARWVKDNPKLTGSALESAMQQQPWDPSVKALTAVPQVLTMMNDRLDWTQQLGDAFLGQQEDVMVAVQVLRARAKAAGTLTTTAQQKVTTTTTGATTVIVIESVQPSVVYVPVYNPTVIYGAWPYAAYPPVYWYPPGYVAGRVIAFGVGVAVGAAIWGDCDWGHHDVTINVNHYNQFNRTTINNNHWQHNNAHRGAVPYSNAAAANRYGRGTLPNAAQRDVYRGKAATQPVRPAASGTGGPATKPGGLGQQPRAYDGIGNGPQVRQQSARGGQSLTSAQNSRKSGDRSDGDRRLR